MKLDQLQLSQTLLHIAIPNPGQLAYATPALRPSGAPPPASPPSLSKFTQRPFQDGGCLCRTATFRSPLLLSPPIIRISPAFHVHGSSLRRTNLIRRDAQAPGDIAYRQAAGRDHGRDVGKIFHAPHLTSQRACPNEALILLHPQAAQTRANTW
ncbi:hypothetical protein CCHR01_00414 [Colletotrichum chrysophilum]|uniref:Uncharacterized protein n=1 Tax=Colletotrichum chrysophilum TaxID=1836956 RepID=A0AAD9B0A0_9PEZI|nr:hypothetical protein CCHR01_00414 [Colletotrichum chrysophilum]